MTNSKLPLRQKVMLSITILSGILLSVCAAFNLLQHKTLETGIIFFGFGVPMFLLSFDTLIDLNRWFIFRIWLMIGVVLVLIGYLTAGLQRFEIARTLSDESKGSNNPIIDYSTSSLKGLLAFLVVYWISNNLLKATKGKCIVNTFRQSKWYNEEAKRKIYWFDVLINLILMLTIFAACIFDY